MRPDGVSEQDVRITLKTDDGAFIYVRYAGIRYGPPEVWTTGSYGVVGTGRDSRSERILFPRRPGVRDWSRALCLAEQHPGSGRGREITAQHSSVLDFRDTVSDTVLRTDRR
jgi:hypothetical protein